MSSALHHIPHRTKRLPPLRVGIGGPVGSGKTTLLEMLCKAMRDRYDLVAGEDVGAVCKLDAPIIGSALRVVTAIV